MNPPEKSNTSKKKSIRHVCVRLLIFSGLLITGVLVFFVSLQRSLIYAASKGAVSLDSARIPKERLREIEVQMQDGILLHGWLSTAIDSDTQPPGKLVILFPGNAGNRSFRTGIIQDFNECGCDCLICDYRGYAENEGKPSEDAFTKDARSIWGFSINTLGYTSDRIVLCGESLGGGVATRLAWDLCRENTPPAGLILRTTFTSLANAAKRLYPWLPVRTFLVDHYPSIDRIPEMTCPILVIHGKLDQIVPFSHGERLYEAAPETSASGIPKMFLKLPNSGHNDLQLTAPERVHDAHAEFLEQAFQAKPATPSEVKE